MSPLKGPARYGATPTPETPHQRAGQAWDERLGSARVQAFHWRLMALGLLALSGGLSAGLVTLSLRGGITPWVVEVDRLGEPGVAAPAVQGARATDPMIAWTLARFITDVRTIGSDPVLMRQAWLRAYDFTTAEGAAALSDHARRADPFSQVGRAQTTVAVTSVVRASPASFRLAWTEQRFEAGRLVATERWTAILTVTIKPPRTAEGLRANPLGVFVTAIAWSQEFGA
ncbi:conjugal transfer protein TrbF [Caulobacter segnis]|uniref:Conjugal transfer protein n=2 Tax=Caulobacter segnis TaxID=88688 RepID=D5VKC8_CAUST|nr:conjugal transfer protein TrbF [Caulobacter segnis]ADG10951.1 Conjugal transfer protein [Caulobacter segnis ATCC 21756]AVQ02644.1 conjugal transfer protein TrbF [Caulobacter segnis]